MNVIRLMQSSPLVSSPGALTVEKIETKIVEVKFTIPRHNVQYWNVQIESAFFLRSVQTRPDVVCISCSL